MSAFDGASSQAARPRPTPVPPEVSVVVPVYRNAGTLIELLDRLAAALHDENYELVFVVDGSPDDSLALLRGEVPRRRGLSVLELTRNFGQHAALCAGFQAARGAVVCVLDADLQQAPEDLPRFLASWRAGHDFVSGRRTVRHDPLRRRIASYFLNRIARRMTGRQLSDWGCPLAAIDRALIAQVPSQGEKRRFLKPLVAELSQNPIEVEVEGGAPRGESSYSFLALVGVALDFVVAFSARPFQRMVGLGFGAFALACVVGGGYLALRAARLIEPVVAVQVGVTIAALLGMQLLVLGALGEFTHRIYRLVQGDPFFEVARRHDRDAQGGRGAE